jgi:hypothetical protein
MPGMPPNCAAAGKTGKTASTSTNGTARLNVMILFPRHTPTTRFDFGSILPSRY